MYGMFLTTKPDLKIIDKNKLRISRGPSPISWILLCLSVIACFQIFRRLTDNVFVTVVSLLGEIMFGLDTIGEWEDLVLDRHANRATLTRCNWSEKLIFRNTNNTSMRLSEIRHVGISVNTGLFILFRDGKIVALDAHGLSRDDMQNHRKEMNYFLNMNKISSLDERQLNPYERIIATSDSDSESLKCFLKSDSSKYQRRSSDTSHVKHVELKSRDGKTRNFQRGRISRR